MSVAGQAPGLAHDTTVLADQHNTDGGASDSNDGTAVDAEAALDSEAETEILNASKNNTPVKPLNRLRLVEG